MLVGKPKGFKDAEIINYTFFSDPTGENNGKEEKNQDNKSAAPKLYKKDISHWELR